MTTQEYQELVMRTCGAAEYHERLAMAAMGLAGEVGEIVDHIKKVVFHSHELDQKKILLEAGDVTWYLALLCNTLNLTFDEVMEANIEKLRRRYPEGWDAERSRNRAEDD